MSGWTRRYILGSVTALVVAPAQGQAAQAFKALSAARALVAARQTAICQLAEINNTQILALLINGEPVEIHARRNGLYLPKELRLSRSVKALSPLDFNRLITAAGGLDTGVNGTARHADLMALYNKVSPAVAALPLCPPDFRSRTPAEQDAIRRQTTQAAYQRYLPCFVPESAATRQAYSSDRIFTGWFVEYDERGFFHGLNLPSVRAVWSLES